MQPHMWREMDLCLTNFQNAVLLSAVAFGDARAAGSKKSVQPFLIGRYVDFACEYVICNELHKIVLEARSPDVSKLFGRFGSGFCSVPEGIHFNNEIDVQRATAVL